MQEVNDRLALFLGHLQTSTALHFFRPFTNANLGIKRQAACSRPQAFYRFRRPNKQLIISQLNFIYFHRLSAGHIRIP